MRDTEQREKCVHRHVNAKRQLANIAASNAVTHQKARRSAVAVMRIVVSWNPPGSGLNEATEYRWP